MGVGIEWIDWDAVDRAVAAYNMRPTERKRWARLMFRLTGRWPQRVVDERMAERHLRETIVRDNVIEALARKRFQEMKDADQLP